MWNAEGGMRKTQKSSYALRVAGYKRMSLVVGLLSLVKISDSLAFLTGC